MANATFVQDGNTIDHIPTSDVSAGDVISMGGLLGIAHVPIPADTHGAIRLSGVYDVVKTANATSGLAFTIGATVYWNTTTKLAVDAAGAGIITLGVCVVAAGKGDGLVRTKVG